MSKAIPELSVDARRLIDFLASVAPDQEVDYPTMSNLVGRDIQKDGRHVLYTALRHLVADHQMVFVAIRGIGIKRLSNHAIPSNVIDATNDKIRRVSKCAVRRLSCVDYGTLTREEQRQHNTGMSTLSAMQILTKVSTQKKIAGEIEKREQGNNSKDGTLPIGSLLQLFEYKPKT